MSGYVVLGNGQAMFFEVRGTKVSRPSPRMPQARGWKVARLLGQCRMQRRRFYAVTRDGYHLPDVLAVSGDTP